MQEKLLTGCNVGSGSLNVNVNVDVNGIFVSDQGRLNVPEESLSTRSIDYAPGFCYFPGWGLLSKPRSAFAEIA